MKGFILFLNVKKQRINVMQYHHRTEISSSNDSSIIEGMMSKACRYSPEEKKERIERYRSKRNQRNFNKKIKVFAFFLIYKSENYCFCFDFSLIGIFHMW